MRQTETRIEEEEVEPIEVCDSCADSSSAYDTVKQMWSKTNEQQKPEKIYNSWSDVLFMAILSPVIVPMAVISGLVSDGLPPLEPVFMFVIFALPIVFWTGVALLLIL
jgi:thiosulfate reductase cytochrome b subunit